MIYILCR